MNSCLTYLHLDKSISITYYVCVCARARSRAYVSLIWLKLLYRCHSCQFDACSFLTRMVSLNFFSSLSKNFFTYGLIGLTISDRYISVVPIRGCSMSPTFNPQCSTSLEASTGKIFQRIKLLTLVPE